MSAQSDKPTDPREVAERPDKLPRPRNVSEQANQQIPRKPLSESSPSLPPGPRPQQELRFTYAEDADDEEPSLIMPPPKSSLRDTSKSPQDGPSKEVRIIAPPKSRSRHTTRKPSFRMIESQDDGPWEKIPLQGLSSGDEGPSRETKARDRERRRRRQPEAASYEMQATSYGRRAPQQRQDILHPAPQPSVQGAWRIVAEEYQTAQRYARRTYSSRNGQPSPRSLGCDLCTCFCFLIFLSAMAVAALFLVRATQAHHRQGQDRADAQAAMAPLPKLGY